MRVVETEDSEGTEENKGNDESAKALFIIVMLIMLHGFLETLLLVLWNMKFQKKAIHDHRNHSIGDNLYQHVWNF